MAWSQGSKEERVYSLDSKWERFRGRRGSRWGGARRELCKGVGSEGLGLRA